MWINKDQINLIYESLNLREFLKVNLYKQDPFTVDISFSFLLNFQDCANLSSKIAEIIKEDI